MINSCHTFYHITTTELLFHLIPPKVKKAKRITNTSGKTGVIFLYFTLA